MGLIPDKTKNVFQNAATIGKNAIKIASSSANYRWHKRKIGDLMDKSVEKTSNSPEYIKKGWHNI
jgi:hypothetical protein